MPVTKLHFLHIGKTGGSAIKHALRPYLEQPPQQFTIHNGHIALRKIPQNDKFFFVLRDPLARFVSGFYSRQRKGRPRLNIEWGPVEHEVFAAYQTPNDLAEALAIQEPLAQKAMNSIFHLTRIHTHYFNLQQIKDRKSDLEFILFQEQLDSDFELFKKMQGLPAKCMLPVNSIHAHKNPAELDRTLSAQAQDTLKNHYKEDYAIIDYCRSLRAEIDSRVSR